MWILIIGNPVDGFKYHGPYNNRADAIKNGEKSLEADWWIATLCTPEAWG